MAATRAAVREVETPQPALRLGQLHTSLKTPQHCDAVFFTIEAAHPCGWIGLPAGRLSEGSRSSTLLGCGPEEPISNSVPSMAASASQEPTWPSASSVHLPF